ncbi:hypothetical protein [Prosthecobacter sp.]|uniref:hypothetical protein n=1 Tax=Prosthecobacter sp. TaxID=1965333 RepID=UPI0037833DFD
MKKGIFAIWASTAVVIIFLFCFLSKQWPLVCTDAVAYWPPIIHGNERGEFNNPTWKAAVFYDPQGLPRLTYHGFLLQWIGRHLGGQTYPGIYKVIGYFAFVAMVVFATCLTMILARKKGPSSGWRIAYLTCLPLAIGHLFLGVFSRPESLVMVWAVLLCAVLIGETDWTPRKAVITGVLLGFCGLTSPVSSILIGSLVAMIAAFKLPPVQMSNWLFLAACTALSSGAMIFFGGYPFDFRDWVCGNLNHAQRAVWSSGVADYAVYFLKETRHIGLYPLFLASILIFSFNRPFKDSLNISQFILRVGSLVFFAGACWYFAIREPARTYNLQALAPFMLTLTGNWIVTSKREITLKFLTPLFFVSLALIACSLVFARNVILFHHADGHGISYSKATEALTHCLDTSKESVDVSMQFITLSSSPKIRGAAMVSQIESEYFMLAQTYSGLTSPPNIAGYELVYDSFSQEVPRILGVKIANTPGSYNFAIYRRLGKKMHR